MPRKPEHETFWESKGPSIATEIDQIMKEEGLYTSSGEATHMRPRTERALQALATCQSMAEFYEVCADNRAWRIRIGETCEHEM